LNGHSCHCHSQNRQYAYFQYKPMILAGKHGKHDKTLIKYLIRFCAFWSFLSLNYYKTQKNTNTKSEEVSDNIII
jgi:hypothetical protein